MPTLAPTSLLTASDVVAWLRTRAVPAGAIIPTRTLPEMPDRIVACFVAGGAPPTNERVIDRPQLQIVVRGDQGSAPSAEALAGFVDDQLLGVVPPVLMNGKRVISIERLGGPPMFVDEDAGRRAIFSCNYIIETARTVH